MCCIWVFEKTAIVFVYSVILLGFKAETMGVYCAVRKESLNKFQVNRSLHVAVPCFGRIVAGVCPQRPGFDPRSVRVRCIVDVVERGTGFPPRRLFGFSPIVISQMLHTHIHPHVALTRGTNGRRLGTFQRQSSNARRREHCVQKYSAT